jgi:hypothetical protein
VTKAAMVVMFDNGWFILCFVPMTSFKNSKSIRTISCEGNLLSILESVNLCSNEVIGTKHNINQPLSNMTTIAALVTGIDVNSQSNDFNQGSTDIDNVVYNHIIESTNL